jgi:hypothetical protein
MELKIIDGLHIMRAVFFCRAANIYKPFFLSCGKYRAGRFFAPKKFAQKISSQKILPQSPRPPLPPKKYAKND